MGRKYKFVFESCGAVVICQRTQEKIAELLFDPSIKLIKIEPVKKVKKRGKNGKL